MHYWIIAKYTLIEAYKRSLIYLYLFGILVCLAIAGYAASLALIEKQAVLAAFFSATTRLMSIAVLGVYVILVETRNLEQENAFVWLGLPVSRGRYLLEKAGAYASLACLMATLTTLPLLWIQTELLLALQWGLSFYCELVMVCSLALLFSVVFKHSLLSLSAYALVYLFARSAAEFYRHSSNIIEQGGTPFETALAWVVKLSTYLVPKLELFASASWLLHQEVFQVSWIGLITQTTFFSALLIFLALAYLRRREF